MAKLPVSPHRSVASHKAFKASSLIPDQIKNQPDQVCESFESYDKRMRDRVRVLNKGRKEHMWRHLRCRLTRRRCEEKLAIYDQKIQELEASVDPVASIDMTDHLMDKMSNLAIDQQSARPPGDPVDVSGWRDLRDRLLEKMAQNEIKLQQCQQIWEEKFASNTVQIESIKFLLHASERSDRKAKQKSTGDAMIE